MRGVVAFSVKSAISPLENPQKFNKSHPSRPSALLVDFVDVALGADREKLLQLIFSLDASVLSGRVFGHEFLRSLLWVVSS